MHPRLVYFYFFRVNFLVKALTSGRCDQVWLPWQRCICRSRYGCFCLSPQVTYLRTKIEGGLKFFISNFASLSWRIALNTFFINRRGGWVRFLTVAILLDFSVYSLLKRQSACAQRLIKYFSSQGDQVFLLPLELSPFLGSCYKQCAPCL